MSPARWPVLGCLVALSCGPPEIALVGDYPANTAWVAAVLLDDTGREVGATPVTTYAPATANFGELDGSEDAEEALVFAWSAEALTGLLPSDGVRLDSPIRLRRGVEPTMPPGWRARSSPLGSGLVASSQLSLPTVGWLPECPVVVGPEEEVVVDIRCGAVACEMTFDQRGCTIPLGLGPCIFVDMDARVDGDGRLNFDGTNEGRCETINPPAGALGSANCNSCLVDVYVRNRTPPPDVPSRSLSLAPPYTGGVAARPPFRGRLMAMAVTSDIIYAAVDGPRGCQRTQMELLAVDAERMEVVAREPFPGCGSAAMAALPDGSIVLATQTSSGTQVARWGIGRRPAVRQPLTTDARPVVSIAVDPVRDRVAVMLSETEMLEGSVVLTRIADLQVAGRTEPIRDVIGGLLFDATGRLFVARQGAIQVHSGSDAAFEGFFMAGTGDGINNDFHVLRDFGTFALGVASSRQSGVHVIQEDAAITAGLAFAQDLLLTDVILSPSMTQPELRGLAVGFDFTGGTLDAFLTRLRPGEARFIPTARKLGQGAVMDLGFDGAGRLWARMPYEGLLRRFEVRDLEPL